MCRLVIKGTQEQIDKFVNDNKITNLSEIDVIVIKMGHITDEEIDSYGQFSDREKSIIKEAYARHEEEFFPNPWCALH